MCEFSHEWSDILVTRGCYVKLIWESYKSIQMTYHRDGLCVMVNMMIPASLALWKILPSTSMLTALVHSSRRANLGLVEHEISL